MAFELVRNQFPAAPSTAGGRLAHTFVEGSGQAPLSPVRIAFVSTMTNSPWGGSENLWHAAAKHLRQSGHSVAINVCKWPELPRQVQELRLLGASVHQRASSTGIHKSRVISRLLGLGTRAIQPAALAHWIKSTRPDLLCISNGCFDDNIHLAKVCLESKVPYTVIAHANSESMWPNDSSANLLLDIYGNAHRSYFVSDSNRRLLEDQLGIKLTNAEIVRNPYSVKWDGALEWPDSREVVRFACVARLHASAKGHDLLFNVLSLPKWRERRFTVSLFGEGPNVDSLKRLAGRLGLTDRIHFRGQINDISRVWKDHHALLLPSRYEGMPISLVEAMLSGRPAVVTDVGGNAELIQDEVNGFVAPSPTVMHYADAMERAWTHRSRWKDMGILGAALAKSLVPENPGARFGEALLRLLRPNGPAE